MATPRSAQRPERFASSDAGVPKRSHPSGRAPSGRRHELPERASLEERLGAKVRLDFGGVLPHVSVDLFQFGNCRLVASPHERVRQRLQHSTRRPTVHVLVGAGKVAQRLPDTVRPRLEDQPFVPTALCLPQRHGKPQLEGHVEPGRRRRGRIELDAREVVEGVPALTNEPDDPIEPAPAPRDLEGGTRSEAAESGEERQEQLFVLGIVGNVEKCSVVGRPPRLPSRRPATGRYLRDVHAQERDVRVRVPTARLAPAFRGARAARARRVVRSAARRRLSMIASIRLAICRARFCESPIVLAVSSKDGTRPVSRILRGMTHRTRARKRMSILLRRSARPTAVENVTACYGLGQCPKMDTLRRLEGGRVRLVRRRRRPRNTAP
jgi:hypothetical protein